MTEAKRAIGQNTPVTDTSGHNSQWFVIQQALRLISTATLVKVGSVTKQGQVGPVGRLDATPLVKMIDGASNTSEHGTIHNLLYARMQGGDSAVILDPKAGDIGLAVFADRDISAVKASKKASPPGSRRRFDMADGIYVMTLLGDTPKRYVRFMDDGTIIVGNGTESESEPQMLVVAADHVSMKWKGHVDMHVTIDKPTNQIIMGKTPVIAPDPHPNDGG